MYFKDILREEGQGEGLRKSRYGISSTLLYGLIYIYRTDMIREQ